MRRLAASASLALMLAAIVSGCASTPPAPESRPDDFAVRWGWDTGSLPPQHHRRMNLELAPDGTLEAERTESYGNGPTTRATATLTAAELDTLYRDLTELGAFSTDWQENERPPIGGSSSWTRITAGGRTIVIPSFVVNTQVRSAAAISDRVRALLPPLGPRPSTRG